MLSGLLLVTLGPEMLLCLLLALKLLAVPLLAALMLLAVRSDIWSSCTSHAAMLSWLTSLLYKERLSEHSGCVY
jgi:hypothetical protein